MTPRLTKTRKVERNDYIIYLKKANDFYETMIDAFKKKNWNSVGLEAVHCAISAADALMVYSKGMRCASEDHKDSVEFLEQNIERREVQQHLTQFRAIISKKNLIEYEERNFSEKEAEELLKRAERFLNWVKEQLR